MLVAGTRASSTLGYVNRPADRCPGVFATHPAADGHLARIRLSGGRIHPPALDALASAASELGDGYLEMTGRANLQVRGIAERNIADFAGRLVGAGLAGSRSHDRVRNITVSPFSGRIGGTAALWTAADRLDDALLTSARSADLSGRFWFGFDDGRGDVLRREPDVVGVAIAPDRATVVVDGHDTGRDLDFDELPAAMVAVAHRFLDLRTDEWRISQLPAAVREQLRPSNITPRSSAARGRPDAPAPRVGWFAQDDDRVLLGAVVPFGRISARQAQFAAAVGAPLIVTPEKELLIGDLTEGIAETVVRVLAPLGFDFDANSPWTRVGACTGAPGCASSRADVRALLSGFLDDGGEITGTEHWVGCERACGTPPGARVRVLDSPTLP